MPMSLAAWGHSQELFCQSDGPEATQEWAEEQVGGKGVEVVSCR